MGCIIIIGVLFEVVVTIGTAVAVEATIGIDVDVDVDVDTGMVIRFKDMEGDR